MFKPLVFVFLLLYKNSCLLRKQILLCNIAGFFPCLFTVLSIFFSKQKCLISLSLMFLSFPLQFLGLSLACKTLHLKILKINSPKHSYKAVDEKDYKRSETFNLMDMVPGKVVEVRTEIQKLMESYIGRGIIFVTGGREEKMSADMGQIAISYNNRKLKEFHPDAFCFSKKQETPAESVGGKCRMA